MQSLVASAGRCSTWNILCRKLSQRPKRCTKPRTRPVPPKAERRCRAPRDPGGAILPPVAPTLPRPTSAVTLARRGRPPLSRCNRRLPPRAAAALARIPTLRLRERHARLPRPPCRLPTEAKSPLPEIPQVTPRRTHLNRGAAPRCPSASLPRDRRPSVRGRTATPRVHGRAPCPWTAATLSSLCPRLMVTHCSTWNHHDLRFHVEPQSGECRQQLPPAVAAAAAGDGRSRTRSARVTCARVRALCSIHRMTLPTFLALRPTPIAEPR